MDKFPKVYFFNDTSGNNHAGCKAVMRSLLHALKNVDIIASHNVHETTYNQAAMNECDVVFVNGEGTIHHHAPAGDFLMEMLALGQKLGKKTMLVNAVFQQLPPYYPEVLAALDFFSVREPFSADNAKESGGNPIVLLDSCADLKFLGGRTIQSLKGIVKGDVHPFSPSAGLFSELPYPFFGIDCAFEDFVATLRNVELYITGQHHGVYGAGLAGIPFVVVPSNSHKIESLISWSGLPIPICHSVTEIKTAIAWALENKHIFHAFQKFLFRNKVFTEELFQQGLNTNYPLFFNRNESSVRTEWQLPEMPLRPQPELIRIYDETSTQFKLIGSTGFFRNRPLLKTILNRIDSECNELKVLFHASSIGSDPFSFCIAFHLYFRGKKMPRLKVFAVDISAQFLNTAQKGCYPQSVLEGMIPEERSYFELLENDQIRVRQEILDMVTFLPPSSFVDFTSTINFDIVFLLNALCYVPAEKQALTIDRIASYNSDLLVVTAYNEDTIESDLRRNGYEPIKNNQELIYNSWQCRLSLPNECMIDGITFHTPALKPYKTISQNDFICTSLFSRRQKNFFCCNVKQNERLPFATGKNLVEVLGSRTVGILLHGKSIATLEQNISDFSELDICWCSINFFGIMEEKILNTIGKQMDVVFCSSRQEIINREHELAEYLQRDYNNILITTAEALKNVPALLNYSHKILTIPKPQLPAYLMPNSLTLLLEAIISMGCAEKIILFGADGLLNNTITVSSAYFGGELLAKQQREWLLVNDTTLFNARFPILLQRILHKQSRSTSPPIANCSPGTVITSFPVIDYIEAFKILTGTIDWPVIANLQQSQDSCKSPVKICEYLGYTLVRYGTQCFAVKPGINWQELTFDRLEHLEMYESKGVCFECITDEAGKNVIDMMHRANTVNLEEYRGFNIISHNGKIFAIANELGNVDMATITNQQLQNWQEQGLVFFADSASSARGKIDCSGYEASPLLLEENFSGYSVLKLGYKYMALSHALGSIDPLAIDISEFQTSDREHLVYINTSIEGVIDSIKGTNKMAINIIAGKNPTYGTTFKISRALLFDGLQPWRKTDKLPKEINPIPSMICDDECAYYHWLARYYFTGEGSIVDFGPLAGGSTYSFASGLELNKFAKQSGKKYIHSYDLWDFFPDWQRFFPETKIVEGANLVAHVECNLGNMLRFVDMHKGDIGVQRWDDSPIEIMFVDAAKSPQTWQHMLLEFFPSLIPGKSIVIHQDWVCLECPWIHITMNMLKDYFVYVDSPDGGSVAFLLIKPIPIKLLQIDGFNEFSTQQCLQHFDECSSNMTNWHRIHVELASVNYLLLKGQISEAKSRLEKIVANNYHYKDMASSSIKGLQDKIDSQLENVGSLDRQQVLGTDEISSDVSRENILFSFLIPTRGRPDLVARLFQSIVDTTSNLAALEVILVIDDDDEVSKSIRDERINFKLVVVPKGLTMGALNQACYRASNGRYIMLMNDDVILRTPGWDNIVLGAFRQFRDDIALIHVNDLLFRERLCTFPFLSRTACEMVGLCPDVYRRYKIDDHIYEIYSMLAHLGHKRIIYLPDVVFEHENHAAQAGPDASEQHVFVSQDSKMYVPHGPTIEKDDKDFTELHHERKQAALTLAAHIESQRITALHESRLTMYADKLNGIKEPYSFRKADFPTVQPAAQPFSSVTHRTTIAVVCSDIRKEMTQRCIATIKEYTDNYDLLILDNAGSKNFNHPAEMNKALRCVATDFLVLMDDDVFVEAGWLDGLMKCIDDTTAVVAPVHTGKAPFTGAYLMGDNQGTHAHTVDIPASPREMQCYCSAILLIDVRKVGHILMEEKYNKYFFDLVHGFMVWEAGYRAVCTPDVIVTHVGGGTMNWGTSVSNQLVEQDRLNFVADWVESGRLARLEEGIWKDYPYLSELIHIPKRIKQLGTEIFHKSPSWLLSEINELWIASEDKELFRKLLNEEISRSLDAGNLEQAKDAPHVLVALGERLYSIGMCEAALTCMKNALENDRNYVDAWAWVTVIARKMNDSKLYAIGYEQASERNPHHPLLKKAAGL